MPAKPTEIGVNTDYTAAKGWMVKIDDAIRNAEPGKTSFSFDLPMGVNYALATWVAEQYRAVGWKGATVNSDQRDGDSLYLSTYNSSASYWDR